MAKSHKQGAGSILLEFFSSMYFAISVLCIIGFASVIGTVLQQNKPYTDYIVKFGPYWHEVFLSLGLYDVYSTIWFILLVFFLVLSTSVCVYRNTPTMLREYRQYREHARANTLKTMRHVQTYQVKQDAAENIQQRLAAFLQFEKFLDWFLLLLEELLKVCIRLLPKILFLGDV